VAECEQAHCQHVKSADRQAVRYYAAAVWKGNRRCIACVALEDPLVDSIAAPDLGSVEAFHLNPYVSASIIEGEVALLLSVVRTRAHQIRYAGTQEPFLLEFEFCHEAEHQAAYTWVLADDFGKLIGGDVPTQQKIGNGRVIHENQRSP